MSVPAMTLGFRWGSSTNETFCRFSTWVGEFSSPIGEKWTLEWEGPDWDCDDAGASESPSRNKFLDYRVHKTGLKENRRDFSECRGLPLVSFSQWCSLTSHFYSLQSHSRYIFVPPTSDSLLRTSIVFLCQLLSKPKATSDKKSDDNGIGNHS